MGQILSYAKQVSEAIMSESLFERVAKERINEIREIFKIFASTNKLWKPGLHEFRNITFKLATFNAVFKTKAPTF